MTHWGDSKSLLLETTGLPRSLYTDTTRQKGEAGIGDLPREACAQYTYVGGRVQAGKALRASPSGTDRVGQIRYTDAG